MLIFIPIPIVGYLERLQKFAGHISTFFTEYWFLTAGSIPKSSHISFKSSSLRLVISILCPDVIFNTPLYFLATSPIFIRVSGSINPPGIWGVIP